MQLGKSLIGAIIGAAVGIVLLVVVYRVLQWDKVWLAIPFAFITGLGVRTLVGTAGHPSYARGALTMLIALAAYIGGWLLVAQMATASAKVANKPANVAEADAANAADATEGGAAPAPAEPPPPIRTTEAPKTRMTAPAQQSNWDLIFLAIAALVAYEMGRGTGASPAPVATEPAEPAEPAPTGAHPDA
jgi:hypothetical protein